MIKRLFKDAFNQFRKNSVGTMINISGMTIGFAVFFLIIIHLGSELAIHNQNTRKKDIFRIANAKNPNGWKGVPAILGEILQENLPEVESFLRLDRPRTPHTIIINEKPEKLGKVGYADSTLFSFFPVEFIHGDPESCLKDPYSMVITESTAMILYGRTNLVGEMVMLDAEHNVRITGVIRDPDNSTHLDAKAYLSFHSMPLIQKNPDIFECMGCFNYDCYLLLSPNVDKETAINKMNSFIHDYGRQYSIDPLYENNFLIDDLNEVYFGKEAAPSYRKGNMQQLKILLAVGVIILLLVLINYVNLANAQSSSQVRELAIRKTIGAGKAHLILMKLIESVTIVLLSSISGFILMLLVKPWFENIIGVTYPSGLSAMPSLYLLIPVGAIIWGILVGLYPSVFVSRLGSSQSLQMVIRDARGRSSVRKVLTVAQLFISVVLVICTSMVFLQMNYTRKSDLGFDSGQLLYLPLNAEIKDRKDAFRQTLMSDPNIENVSYSYGSYRVNTERWGLEFNNNPIELHMEFVDEYYLETIGLTLIEGRNFIGEADAGKILINRAAKEEFFPAETIGTIIDRNDRPMEIVGVVEDFHFMSFHSEVEPLAMMYSNSRNSMVNVRFREGSSSLMIPLLKSRWSEFVNSYPFDYSFVSDYYDSMYNKEIRLGQLFIFFSFISIFIASLGIYGLITFLVIKRAKEVTVRKINGARFTQILGLFMRELSSMVIIAAIPSMIISVWLMDNWFNGFSYRINFPWSVLPVALLLVWLVTMLTALGRSIKAARINPVVMLRRL